VVPFRLMPLWFSWWNIWACNTLYHFSFKLCRESLGSRHFFWGKIGVVHQGGCMRTKERTWFWGVLGFVMLVSCGGGSSSVDGGMDATDETSALSDAGNTVEVLPASARIAQTPNAQDCLYDKEKQVLVCREKTYRTVRINAEIWMAENLDVGLFITGKKQNNDSLLEKFCPGGDPANCDKYGGLYQWAEAMGLPAVCNAGLCGASISKSNHQGICPNGWHMPVSYCWHLLAKDLGGEAIAGRKMKSVGTGISSWDAPLHNDGNSSGFSAYPVGERNAAGMFVNMNGYATFWEAGESNALTGIGHGLAYGSDELAIWPSAKLMAFAVRCAKNDLE